MMHGKHKMMMSKKAMDSAMRGGKKMIKSAMKGARKVSKKKTVKRKKR